MTAASRVATCGVSSTMTTLPAARGSSSKRRRSGRWCGRRGPRSAARPPPCGWRQGHHRPPGDAGGRGRGVESGGFAVAGGGDQGPHRRPGTTRHPHRLDLVVAQRLGLGGDGGVDHHGRDGGEVAPGEGVETGQESVLDAPQLDVRPVRWPAAGLVGTRRTTRSLARNRRDTSTISAVVRRPADMAATRSTTWASPKRESPAHNRCSGRDHRRTSVSHG